MPEDTIKTPQLFLGLILLNDIELDSMVEVKIRQYAEGDREQCRGLWGELTEWHREIYQEPTIGGETPEEAFDEHLAAVGSNNLWVALKESKVVGLVGLIAKEKEAEVEPVIVRADQRGKGIGQQLLTTVIAVAQQRGFRFLNVRPVARNQAAISFFFNRGFRTLGHIQLFMDFSDRAWKPGPELFGHDFNY